MVDFIKYEINVSNLGALAISLDNNHQIIYSNNLITDKLLFGKNELIGMNILDIISDKDKNYFKNLLKTNNFKDIKPTLLSFFDKTMSPIIFET